MRKASSLVRQGRLIGQNVGQPISKTFRRPLNSSPSLVQITTLPNKIRVATESTPGHFSSVGLYIDAGSRYESPQSSGVSHFLDRMAFKVSATTYSLRQKVLLRIDCRALQLEQIQKCQQRYIPSEVK